MTDAEIRKIVADIYKGLQYIASKNIIHRDLKIANVFMHNGVAKIADFGFALHCTYLIHNVAIILKI
jgi:serine/threonine protein kinase